ncbi:lysophospholipase [Azospirillum sp. ST 5-10]|uniref:alpha/beta hydrolase n=1 Tax=unclassified Azospirillum TaxID=2630922 RepID=UPI003F4A1A95
MPERIPTIRRLAAVLVLGLLLTGCAARLQPMGPALADPQLADGAIVAADGYTLPTRSWLPETGRPRAVVLALHGFNDYSNAFADTGRAFAANGIATYAYDQRGFGATRDPGIWPGVETLVADLRTATAVVRSRHPGVPFYLLGESMGGAVVLTALDRADALPVDGAILVAPAVWGKEVMGFFPRAALWLTSTLVPGLTVSAPKELDIQPSDNIEMLRALGRDPLVIKASRIDTLNGLTDLMGRGLEATGRLRVPALVLYGAHEEVLPPRPVKRAIAELEASGHHRIAVYPDGYHMLLRDLQGPVVQADIIQWIEHPDLPLASGADRAPRTLVAEK